MDEIKDTYKLKRFGNYIIEIDTDNLKEIKKFKRILKRTFRFRFIRFALVPMGMVKLTEIAKGKKNG